MFFFFQFLTFFIYPMSLFCSLLLYFVTFSSPFSIFFSSSLHNKDNVFCPYLPMALGCVTVVHWLICGMFLKPECVFMLYFFTNFSFFIWIEIFSFKWLIVIIFSIKTFINILKLFTVKKCKNKNKIYKIIFIIIY